MKKYVEVDGCIYKIYTQGGTFQAEIYDKVKKTFYKVEFTSEMLWSGNEVDIKKYGSIV